MKSLAQLKKLAQFAKEHSVIQIEFNTNGEVSKLLFNHKPEPPEVPFSFEKPKKDTDDDDLFFSVDAKPNYMEKRNAKKQN